MLILFNNEVNVSANHKRHPKLMQSLQYHTHPLVFLHSYQEKPMGNSLGKKNQCLSQSYFLQSIQVNSLQGGPRALVLHITD